LIQSGKYSGLKDLIRNYPSIITVGADEGDDVKCSASTMDDGCEEDFVLGDKRIDVVPKGWTTN
jgi:hypothetical protein